MIRDAGGRDGSGRDGSGPDERRGAARSRRGQSGAERPARAFAEAGRLGEEHAARFLERAGYRIRERNWRCPAGEIDLIAEHGEFLVFVEVKTRSARDAFGPVLAMTKRKQRRVRELALRYIEGAFGGRVPALQPRFDVLLVILGREPQVEHLTNAF